MKFIKKLRIWGNVKNKLIQILKTYFLSVGVCAVVFTVIEAILKLTSGKKLLIEIEDMTVAILPIVVFSVLVFKTGVSKKELWLRRGVIMFFTGTVLPLLFILISDIAFKSPFIYVLYFAFCLVLEIVYSVIAFSIADRIEHRAVDRINTALEKNRED